MSILSALKQEGSSIDELAKLPQAMIMQMAQKKQINAEMVAPILSRKAEMADAMARTKAMQGAGAPQPTVMEQLMQKNAEAEQPVMTDGRDMGIASNPIPERNYAGGGIVAFANGGSTGELPPRQEGESENAYMQRVQAIYDAGSQFFNPRNYNPLAKLQDLYGVYDRNIGQPFAEGVKRFVEQPLGEQADKFRSYAQKPKTEAGIAALAPKTPDSQYEEQGKNAYVSQPVKPTVADKEDKKLVDKPATKPQSPLQKATGAPEMPETKVDPIDALIAKYEKMIAGDPEASAKARKEAMWSRLTEAGLGIMGGESSNFAQNIGRGATQAMKGYAEDVKGLRAEENAKLTQLAGLGLKGAGLKQEARKLGITEKHYDDWLKTKMLEIAERGADRKEIAAGRLEGVKSRADTAMDNRVATVFGKLITQPKYMDNPELAYADAQKLVTGQSAQPTFAGFSGRPLK
jgi:hypothetical protein